MSEAMKIIAYMLRGVHPRYMGMMFACFLLGMWVQGRCWRQLRGTREAWEIERGQWDRGLLLAAATVAGGWSLAASALKREQKRRTGR